MGILIGSSNIPICNEKEGAATVQLQISDCVPFQFIHNTVININSRIVEPHYHPNPIQTYLPFDCEQYSTAITERKGSHPVPPSLSQFDFFGVKLNFFLKIGSLDSRHILKLITLRIWVWLGTSCQMLQWTTIFVACEVLSVSFWKWVTREIRLILRVQFPMFTVVREDNS